HVGARSVRRGARGPMNHRQSWQGRICALPPAGLWIPGVQPETRADSRMATTNSFDVSTGADLQEVDNAVNQARKEIQQRYDFKGTNCTIDFDRGKSMLTIEADDE